MTDKGSFYDETNPVLGYSYDLEALIIELFKKPALTTTLPAQLSKKYNLGIIPVYIEREKK